MLDFNSIWNLVKNHGGVAEFYLTDAARLWDSYDEKQREHIYRAIQTKLAAGRFVNYNPVKAFLENAPKPPKIQILSFNDYYAKYGTTEEKDGWKMANPTGQQVIYVKQN